MKRNEDDAVFARTEQWWPADLGDPTASGERNNIRYAFFVRSRTLLIQRGAFITTYDAGDRQIWGMERSKPTPVFNTQHGRVELQSLNKIETVISQKPGLAA